jgi:amino acid adenylation domain-containing protein
MSDSSLRQSKLSAAKQALLKERMRGISGAKAEAQIPVRSQKGIPAPLSFGQHRLWFMEQLRPGNLAYNISSAARLSGRLDARAFARALDEVVRRHEVLRTTFSAHDAIPVQVVMPHQPSNLEAEDFSGVDEGSRENEIKRVLAEESQRPFDLSRDALFRVRLLRFSTEDHALLLTLHHIISDEWSTAVFMRELTALYSAFSRGEASPLPELPIQYADYAIWQRERLQGEVLERQHQYWREKLSGELPMLELPTDNPRPPMQSFAGAREILVLPQGLTQRLNALAKEEEATSFMTMLAAFKALLARYTGQTDIIVGTPIANRSSVETEKLIGFFVNTLVLRTDLSGNPSFRELLKRVKETSLGAYSHQELPFERLVEELEPERDIGRNPLFQVQFILHTVANVVGGLQGVTMSAVGADTSATRFDIELHVVESAKSLVATCIYNTDLFEAATIARMLEHFRVLLEGIVADPDRPVFLLPLLTTDERERMLHQWNSTGKEYSGPRLVHEFFEAQAELTPDNTAVRSEASSLTYAELNRRSNQLAHHLRRLGVGTDVVTGVLMERSVEMMIAVLAILKAGGVYVSLDPTYPDERLRVILDNAQPHVVLLQEHLRRRLRGGDGGEHAARAVSIDADWPVVARESAQNPVRQSTDEHRTYIIYTSGSTGTPKGVGLPHRSLVNLIHWMREMRPEPLQTMQFASLNFDVSFMEMFSTWSNGGTLVLVPEMLRQDVNALGRFLIENRIEKAILPVVVLQQLAEFYVQEQAVTSLREIIVTGEQFRVTSALRKLFAEWETCVLYNQYGPSETHVVTSYTMEGAPAAWPTLPPIGGAISNAHLYILDEHFEPVPIGVKGELYIGGISPGRGYLGRPEMTAEKFVPDPFSLLQGARLYRSGDIVRYTSEGYVEFVERRDQQVKIRGFRVELGEIEAVLVQHERVGEAVAVAREGEAGERKLVAYLVGTGGRLGAVTTAELRRHVKEQLPDYMIPSTFVWLESLPLTPNGKVNRKALPLPDQQRPELGSNYVAPRTKTEETLAEIWSELLGLSLIGAHDDFFELGGHSMLVPQLINRINQAFQIQLSLAVLFENPTVSGLAQSIEAETEAREAV